MSSAFVTSRGSLIRRGRDVTISKRRASFFLILTIVLTVTNPPNYLSLNNLTKSHFGIALDGTRIASFNGDRKSREKPARTLSWKIFGYEFDLVYRSDSRAKNSNGRSKFGTNFGIFTLDDRGVSLVGREVVVGALLNEVRLCRYNLLDEESFCSWVADNVCHDMSMWTRKYRAYTAHRIIAFIFVFSVILSYCKNVPGLSRSLEIGMLTDSYECSIRNVASWGNAKNRPLAVLLSVFYRPTLITDLLLLNTIVYPPLILLEKAVRIGTGDSSFEADILFGVAVFTIFVIIGGISNLVASIGSGRGCFGAMGSFAGFLGYQTAVAPTAILISKTYIGTDVTAVDVLVFLTMLEVLNLGVYLNQWLPYTWQKLTANAFFLFRSETTSSPVAWLVGGLLGIAYGHYQVERYALHWRLW